MTDQFDGYKKLLALAQVNPTKNKLRQAMVAAGISFENEGEPWSGYYRMAESKGGPLEAIAIWRDEQGELLILWGENQARPEKVWPWCGMSPIPFEWYEAKTGGKEWPDGHAAATEDEPEALDAPGIGDNKPPADNESGVLREKIAEARAGLKKYAKITSDETAMAAQSLRSTLNELAGEAERLRKKLKAPHWDAAQAVDGEWMPVVESAKRGANLIKDALEAWENEKLMEQKRLDAVRLAEEEKRAQELLDAQAEAEGAAARGEADPPSPPLPLPPPPAPIAPTTSIKGATGRNASVGTVKQVTEVTDWVALFNYFRNDKEVTDLLLVKANRMLKLNPLTQIPGVKIDDKRKVA